MSFSFKIEDVKIRKENSQKGFKPFNYFESRECTIKDYMKIYKLIASYFWMPKIIGSSVFTEKPSSLIRCRFLMIIDLFF